MTARLRLRALFIGVDWYIELCDAYARRRWADFFYCLEREPSLFEREVLDTHAAPFILCVESGDLEVVRAALALGADVETPCERVADLEHGRRRYIEPRAWPYFFITLNGLALSRQLGCEDIHQFLLERTSERGRALALQAFLLTGDEAGARALGLARPLPLYNALRAHPPSPSSEVVPPVTAALLGGCGADFVEELLQLGGKALAREPFHHSPGYGHDNDELYGGSAADWARVLGRLDLVDGLTD